MYRNAGRKTIEKIGRVWQPRLVVIGKIKESLAASSHSNRKNKGVWRPRFVVIGKIRESLVTSSRSNGKNQDLGKNNGEFDGLVS